MGKIKCPKCVYESDSWSVKRHLKRKHKEHLTTANGTYRAQRNYASHSYVNPYITKGRENNNHVVQEPTSHQHAQLKTSYMQAYPQLQPVHHGQVVHQQPIHHGQVAHQQPVQDGLSHNMSDIPHRELWSVQNQPQHNTLKYVMHPKNHVLQQDLTDSMDTDEHPQDFLPESDSEESDIDVAHEVEDIITDMEINFTNIVRLRKKYLKALEKYNEIDDQDKRDIFKKYIKFKGKIWAEWYNLEEEDEEESEENEQESEENEQESEEEGGEEGMTKCGQEGEEDGAEEGEDGEGQGKSEVNYEEQDKNNLMNFVLQLESVADEDDKKQIERLWKKQLNRISMLKESEIDSNDTDSENEDDTDSKKENEEEDEDEDTFVWLNKNKNRIKKMIEEFEERGNNYFKHCNKEKIETIGTWCKQLINNQSKMVKNTKILNNVKKTLTPVRSNIRKLADSNYPISKQRKMLQEVQVGKGVMTVMETVVLPFINQLLRNIN
jgi:hypothetical protein